MHHAIKATKPLNSKDYSRENFPSNHLDTARHIVRAYEASKALHEALGLAVLTGVPLDSEAFASLMKSQNDLAAALLAVGTALNPHSKGADYE